MTEGCDNDRPHLSTDGHITPEIEQDHHARDSIHAHLASSGLLPGQQLVDGAPFAKTRTSRFAALAA